MGRRNDFSRRLEVGASGNLVTDRAAGFGPLADSNCGRLAQGQSLGFI